MHLKNGPQDHDAAVFLISLRSSKRKCPQLYYTGVSVTAVCTQQCQGCTAGDCITVGITPLKWIWRLVSHRPRAVERCCY